MLFKLLHFMLLMSVSALSLAESDLVNHPSPYIRMHADDAVEWRVWDQSVIEQAKKENKLIFISIGYYACHWCHVMREESFTDKKIGKLINDNFLAVKVDRELNPALDNYLMSFMMNTNGYGGWPLNVFVTPQGYPLLGIVYKPADEFNNLLVNLQGKWHSDNESLNELAKQAVDFFRLKNLKKIEPLPAEELKKYFMMQLHRTADELMGGLGEQAKFPRVPLMLMLLDLYKQHNDEWLKQFIVLTLDQIMQGGLHDVVAGGFFRYTVDPGWRIPHFEKMLYTNAGLIQVYLKAYQIFKDEKYIQIAIETAEFIIRDMKIKHGGFASSINSQDEQGEEGGAYVWSKSSLEKLLTPHQIKKIKTQWDYVDLQDTGDVLPVGLALGNDWQDIKNRLQVKRKQRPHAIDEKRLPSWNGYVLTALAQVVKITGRDDFKQVGEKLYQLLHRQSVLGLSRPAVAKRKFLEDYAFVAQGLFDWRHDVLNKEQDAVIDNLLDEAIRLFASNDGWRLSDTALLPMPSDQLNLPDAQLPAADVVVLRLLHRSLRMDSLSPVLPASGSSVANRWNRLDARLMDSPIDFASRVQYQLEYDALNKIKH